MTDQDRTFYLLSLGCPKNEVDSDCLASTLMRDGWQMSERPEDAGVIVVNTCSFIAPAVEESVEAVLELGDLKESGDRRLVVTGCLVARYGERSLKSLLPEVDLCVGFPDYARFASLIDTLLDGDSACSTDTLVREQASSLSKGYVFLKISEGCRRRCAYCAIPSIRGPLRSRPWEEIRDEWRFFLERGAHELVLIAQDSTSYGRDIYGRPSLPMLMENLCELDGDWRLRVMYMHPEGVDAGILQAMGNPRVCHYLDLPFQHVDAGVLRSMGRRGDADSHRRLLDMVVGSLCEVALRATFMVGFPGEDRAAFDALYDFVAEARFDWLGLFSYSQEEGTPAFSLGRGVSGPVARDRVEEITVLQEEIMRDKALEMVGKKMRVLVEEISLEAPGFWEARSWREAPEIDGVIFIPHKEGISPGTLREVVITASEGIDLVGVLQTR